MSVRQPWAWAIIHAGKDIENRSAAAVERGLGQPGRRAIHAAKGMTRDEYEEAAEFMAEIGIVCPPPADLLRGGIIGSVEVAGVVKASASRWFFGPRGLALRDPVPCDFIPAVGALGLFRWQAGQPFDCPASGSMDAAAPRARPETGQAHAGTSPPPGPLQRLTMTRTLALLLAIIALSACDIDSRPEIARNSEDERTGPIAEVGGCTVYRVRNTGDGPTWVFFTKCRDSCQTTAAWDLTRTVGKSTVTDHHTVSTTIVGEEHQ